MLGAPVIRRIAVPVALRAALVPSNRSAETSFRFTNRSSPGRLQWGRAPRSAETSRERAERKQRCFASMGPRSEERGNSSSDIPHPCRSTRFNGAALRGARKQALRRSYRFGQTHASMGPRSEERGNTGRRAVWMGLSSRFNGAALRGARKLGLSHSLCCLRYASMGPRSEERGNRLGSRCPGRRRARFNGAALRGARKQAMARHFSV